MTEKLNRADVLAAFGVTENDLAALDPDGSYVASRDDADRVYAVLRDAIPERAKAVADRINVSGMLPDGYRVVFDSSGGNTESSTQ